MLFQNWFEVVGDICQSHEPYGAQWPTPRHFVGGSCGSEGFPAIEYGHWNSSLSGLCGKLTHIRFMRRQIGTLLVELYFGKGRVFASEMMLLEASSDPIAGKLLCNLIEALGSVP